MAMLRAGRVPGPLRSQKAAGTCASQRARQARPWWTRMQIGALCPFGASTRAEKRGNSSGSGGSNSMEGSMSK